MKNKKLTDIPLRDVEKIIKQQTHIILTTLNKRRKRVNNPNSYYDTKTIQSFMIIEKKLREMEIRINKKIDKLIAMLNKFLKRPTIKERLLRYK